MSQAIQRIIQLTVDANQAHRELRRIGQSTSKMEKGLSKAARTAKAFGAAFAAQVTAQFSVGAIRNAIDYADAIGKTADKLGVGVEALQAYRYAGEQAGVSQQTLDMAMQRFARRSAEAAKGTGELVKVYQELGINLRDSGGSLKSSEQLLTEYAKAILEVPSSMERLRLAFKGFDSEGVAMVNVLPQIANGLDDVTEAARQAGVVIDERTTRKAEELKSTLTLMSSQIKKAVIPALVDLTDVFADLFNLSRPQSDNDMINRLLELRVLVPQVGAELEKLEASGATGRMRRGRADRIREQREEYERLGEELARLEKWVKGYKLDKQVAELQIEVTGVRRGEEMLERWKKSQEEATKAAKALAEQLLDGLYPERVLNRDLAAIRALPEKFLDAADKIKAIKARMEEDPILQEIKVIGEKRNVQNLEFVDRYKEQLEEIKTAAEGFARDFTDTLVDGLAEGELRFDEFAKNVLSTIAKMVMNEYFTKFFTSIAGGITGGFTGGGVTAGGGTAPVPTQLGAAPQTMAVGILRPPSLPALPSNTRPAVKVNITNNAPVEISAQENVDAGGNLNIELMVENQVKRSMSSGALDRTMNANYGLRRRAF